MLGSVVGLGLGLAGIWLLAQIRKIPFTFDILVLLVPVAALAGARRLQSFA